MRLLKIEKIMTVHRLLKELKLELNKTNKYDYDLIETLCSLLSRHLNKIKAKSVLKPNQV